MAAWLTFVDMSLKAYRESRQNDVMCQNLWYSVSQVRHDDATPKPLEKHLVVSNDIGVAFLPPNLHPLVLLVNLKMVTMPLMS